MNMNKQSKNKKVADDIGKMIGRAMGISEEVIYDISKSVNIIDNALEQYKDGIEGTHPVNAEIEEMEYFNGPTLAAFPGGLIKVDDREKAMNVFMFLVYQVCDTSIAKKKMRNAFKRHYNEVIKFADKAMYSLASSNYIYYMGEQDNFNAALIATALYVLGYENELAEIEDIGSDASDELHFKMPLKGLQDIPQKMLKAFIHDKALPLSAYAGIYSFTTLPIDNMEEMEKHFDIDEFNKTSINQNRVIDILRYMYNLPDQDDVCFDDFTYLCYKNLIGGKEAKNLNNPQFSTFAYSSCCVRELVDSAVKKMIYGFRCYAEQCKKAEEKPDNKVNNTIDPAEIKRLNDKIKALEEENDKKQKIINKVSKELEHIKRENEKKTDRKEKDDEKTIEIIEATRGSSNGQNNIELDEAPLSIDEMKEYINTKKIIIVGGNASKSRQIEELFPNARVVYSDQYNRDNVDANMDMVFILTACTSHALSKKYVRGSRQTGVPLTYIKDNNINIIIKCIYDALAYDELARVEP